MSGRSPFRHSSHHSRQQQHAPTNYPSSTASSASQNSDDNNNDDLLSIGEPSFSSLARVATSTPRKTAGQGHAGARGAIPNSPGGAAVFSREEEDRISYASDTESFALVSDDEVGLAGEVSLVGQNEGESAAGRVRLARRRLTEFSSVARQTKPHSTLEASTSNPLLRTSGPSTSTSATASTFSHSTSRTATPRATPHLAGPSLLADISLARTGAPSPSTASSTLVDSLPSTATSHSDHTVKPAQHASPGKGKQRAPTQEPPQELTLRDFGGRVDYPGHSSSDDERTAHPARVAGTGRARRSTSPPEESSSSPPSRRAQLPKSAALSSYLSSHTPARSVARPSSRADLATPATPQTPAAPGAYPPTARKPLTRRDPSSLPHSAPPETPATSQHSPRSSPADQIHDIFNRVLRGPDGALTKSAERRAALLRDHHTPTKAGLQTPGRSSTTPRVEPKTPHPSGYYNLDSPVAAGPAGSAFAGGGGGGFGARSPLPVRTPRTVGGTRQVTWEDERLKLEDEDGEDEEAPASPIGRDREVAQVRTDRQAAVQSRRPARTEDVGEVASQVRARPPFEAVTLVEAHSVELDGHEDSLPDGQSDDGDAFEERAKAERSAIAFAMRSFEQTADGREAHELSEKVMDAVLAQAEARARAELVRSTTPSPPPSPVRSPSPDLPPLPDMANSPSPVKPARRPRTPLHSSRDRILDYTSPPKHQHFNVADQPQRSRTPPPTSSPRRPLFPSPRKPEAIRPDSHAGTRSPADLAADPLVELAASFTLAVRDLAASANAPLITAPTAHPKADPAASGGSSLAQVGLPAPAPPTHLSQLLARRKHDSDARRAALETDMRALEAEGEEDEAAQAGVQARLAEVGREEGEIQARLGEVAQAVRRVRTRGPEEKVVEVEVEVVREGSNARRLWWGLLLQFALLWLLFRHANTRAHALEPNYSRYLVAPSPGPYGSAFGRGGGEPKLLPETVTAFGLGVPPGRGTFGGAEWLGRWGTGPVASRVATKRVRDGRVPV